MPIFPTNWIPEIAASAAVTLLTACTAVNDSSSAGLALSELHFPFAVNSGLQVPQVVVVRDRAHWQQLWDELSVRHRPRPALPDIDFNTHAVVLAAMGRQRSGGHRIKIKSANLVGDDLHVVVEETYPAAECMVTMSLTAPADVMVVPRHDGEMLLERLQVRTCG